MSSAGLSNGLNGTFPLRYSAFPDCSTPERMRMRERALGRWTAQTPMPGLYSPNVRGTAGCTAYRTGPCGLLPVSRICPPQSASSCVPTGNNIWKDLTVGWDFLKSLNAPDNTVKQRQGRWWNKCSALLLVLRPKYVIALE